MLPLTFARISASHKVAFARLAAAFLLGLGASLALALPALAQTTATDIPDDNAVNAIAKEMYCPVCENIPLDVCGTQACHQWRELIRQKLAEGWSEQQIKDYFVAQYGDRVLAEPPREGLNWLVYIVPPAVIFIAIIITVLVLRGWQNQAPQPVETQPKPLDDYARRIEEDLRKRS